MSARDGSLGLGDEVIVVEHDPSWPARYVEERDILQRALGPAALAIEHVGSTSVPGLAAKPIIDILVVVRDPGLPLDLVDALCAADYRYFGPYGLPGRQYFSKGRRGTHHVHAFPEGHTEIERQLLFRDHLRSHPDDARRYESLKRELAVTHHANREQYTDAKSGLIRELLARASESWHARGAPRLY